jgi:hypothetical protein
VHSYYHLVPLVCCYCSSGLPTLVCFLVFHRLMGKHLMLQADVVFGFKSFSEASCLAWKCGTHRSNNPVRAL